MPQRNHVKQLLTVGLVCAPLVIAGTAPSALAEPGSLAEPAMSSAQTLGAERRGLDGPATPEEFKASVLARSAGDTVASRAEAFAPMALPEGGFGNGILQVYVEQTFGLGIGSFTVLTGPDHPAGEGHNVLFGDGIPGTSYMTVRDVEAGIDYVQGQLLTHPSQVPLDDRIKFSEPLGDTGMRTTWIVSGSDWLVQDVIVHGTTQQDSRVEVTTVIHDVNDVAGDEFEIQYLWDVALGEDDGPALQPQPANSVFRPFDALITTEHVLTLLDDHLVVVDNDGNDAVPTMAYGGTISGPGDLTSGPMPSAVSYVCWPDAIFARLGSYQIDPERDISTAGSDCTSPLGGNDSALLYHWAELDDSIGEGSVAVSASLFASPPVPHATAMTARAVVLNLPGFQATLTDTVHDEPIPGRIIEFVVGSQVRCTAVTNASGVAGCGTLSDTLAAILRGGYTARYDGGAIWAPSSARGRLL